jgi:hypothetical protein
MAPFCEDPVFEVALRLNGEDDREISDRWEADGDTPSKRYERRVPALPLEGTCAA